MASITQVFGPQVSGGYKLAIVVDRNPNQYVTETIAKDFLGINGPAFAGETWLPQVKDRFQVFAVTLPDGHDFHTRPPPDGDTTLLADYQDFLPVVRKEFPEASCVGVASREAPAGHGSGGTDVFAFSTSGSSWWKHASHEWAHSCGCADEYVFGAESWVGTQEPLAPNITINFDPASCKWRKFFPATGGVVRRNSQPWEPLVALPYLPRNQVAIREGAARRYKFGVARPTDECRMGTSLDFPFCAVCQAAIVARVKGSAVVEPVPVPPATRSVDLVRISGSTKQAAVPANWFGSAISYVGLIYVSSDARTYKETNPYVVTP